MYYIFLRFSRQWRAAMRLINGFSLMADYIMDACSQILNSGFEKIENLISKYTEQYKMNRETQIELEKHEVLNDNDFPKYNSKFKIYITLLILMIICEGFLNYLTTLIVIPVEEDATSWIVILLQGARIVLAVAATIAAIVSVDWVLEELLPNKKLQTYVISKEAKELNEAKSKKVFSISNLILGAIMLAGIEFAIYNFGLKRAQDFEGGSSASAATEALIMLSMIVPVIAGVIWWDINQYRHALFNRKKLERIRYKLHHINNCKNEAIKRLETFFKLETSAFHKTFLRFKIRKEFFNLKKGIENENLTSHFCRSYEEFEKKAKERTAKKLLELQEKLKVFDETINDSGNKLNQKFIESHELEK